MQETDAITRDWREWRVGRPLHREMTFTEAGLALGCGTLLSEFEKKGRVADGLALDGNEARLLSLLTAAYRQPLAGGVIEKIRRAGETWRSGDKALAQIHLAFLGLPKIGEADAYRLFLARTALERGASPSELMKALGFPRAARNLEKYWEDQPRVPAGSGRESGEWTSGDGGGAGAAQTPFRDAGNTHSPILSDAAPDPILPGQQYAQSVTRPDLQDGIAVEPFGEAVVSFNNLPKGSKQVLQYRFFVQDDQTGLWRIGMAFPVSGTESRPTFPRRGSSSEEVGIAISPPGSPPLEEGKEPISGIRLGYENDKTGQPYFRVFNDSRQAISPVTGRTVDTHSDLAHYPLDLFSSTIWGP